MHEDVLSIYNSKDINRQNLFNDQIESLYGLLKFMNENFEFDSKKVDTNSYISLKKDGRCISNLNEGRRIFIKNYNAALILPDKNSLILEKDVVLEWIAYNTPRLKDISITPVYGTGYLEFIKDNWLFFESDETFSKYTYLQWYITLFYLGWEYDKLYKVKSYLDNRNLHNNLEDVKDKYVIYWLNRQVRLQDLGKSIEDKFFIFDIFDEFQFYREISEDFMYVLLNLILGIKIINSFDYADFVNNKEDEFVIKLTDIIKEHYTLYSEEYQYLDELRWYKINYMMSTSQILDIYKWEISNRAKNKDLKK